MAQRIRPAFVAHRQRFVVDSLRQMGLPIAGLDLMVLPYLLYQTERGEKKRKGTQDGETKCSARTALSLWLRQEQNS